MNGMCVDDLEASRLVECPPRPVACPKVSNRMAPAGRPSSVRISHLIYFLRLLTTIFALPSCSSLLKYRWCYGVISMNPLWSQSFSPPVSREPASGTGGLVLLEERPRTSLSNPLQRGWSCVCTWDKMNFVKRTVSERSRRLVDAQPVDSRPPQLEPDGALLG